MTEKWGENLMKKSVFFLIPVIMLILTGCPDSGVDSEDGGNKVTEDPPLAGKEVVLEMVFSDDNNWDKPGNEDWSRWVYNLQDENNLFDLSSMLTNKKVYILTYSFSTNINIDELTTYFYNMDTINWNWQAISEYVTVKNDIKHGVLYTGKIAYVPTSNAAGLLPEDTRIRFDAHNRKVNTAAIIYFYQFDLEEADKEDSLETWTVSGKEFTIGEGTYAEITSFDSKSDVLHIKPSYGFDEYADFVMQYDLNDYKGKKIKIEMSMDVYLKTPSWVAWQINSNPTPYYPLVLGACEGPPDGKDKNGNLCSSTPLPENTWINITGEYTYTVPNTDPTNDNGKQLYLSGMQIAGAEAYFANATFTITEVTP